MALALATLALSASAAAHEFWLMPEHFSVAQGERVVLGLRVGSGWPGEVLVRDGRRQVRFAWVDAAGEKTVGGQPGDDPAGTVQARSVGPAWAVYRSPASFIVLQAEAFEAYLRDEGLDTVIAARRERGQSDAPGREAYSRCAKSLVQVEPGGGEAGSSPSGDVPGDASADASADASGEVPGLASREAIRQLSRPVGLTLELVPLNDPRRASGGDPLRVQLLYRGQPLAGALVKALPRAQGSAHLSARTDAQGVATLPMAAAGVWLLNAVHMVPAAPGLDADWQSLWSSLTFERPAALP